MICIIFIIFITFILFNNLCNNKKYIKENFDENNKLCCFYAYYEKNMDYKNNFQYFLNNAILDNVDYYIIINGKSSIFIPSKKNIKIYYRENKGYDFGAYSYAIDRLNKKYDYYFFLNTSVKGPYLKKNIPWTTFFLNLFQKDVKVVGTSINIYSANSLGEKYNLYDFYNKNPPYPHVQSMFFCIDYEYFEYLKNNNFFNEYEINNAPDMDYIIVKKEIGLSQNALEKGWNINCILSKYKNLDYRKITKDINNSSFHGDPYYSKSYFGKDIDKYEVIFYKNNRAIFPKI